MLHKHSRRSYFKTNNKSILIHYHNTNYPFFYSENALKLIPALRTRSLQGAQTNTSIGAKSIYKISTITKN